MIAQIWLTFFIVMTAFSVTVVNIVRMCRRDKSAACPACSLGCAIKNQPLKRAATMCSSDSF